MLNLKFIILIFFFLFLFEQEVVKAQQIQNGPMHAAGILFERVIKRPDWLDDLTKALRDPEIGLTFLAEKLHKFEGQYTVE